MNAAQVLRWKAVTYLTATATALALMVSFSPAEPMTLLMGIVMMWSGGMAAYLIIVKGARWHVSDSLVEKVEEADGDG